MRAILTGEATGGAVLLRPAALAKAVCGQDWSELSSDATQLVMGAKRLSGLFGAMCLVLGDDPALADDGRLVASRIAVLAEAVRRVADEGSALPVICVIPGPTAMAAASDGVSEELKHSFAQATESLCAGRPALLLFDESAADPTDLESMSARRIYNTLHNVAAYFSVKIGALLPAGAGSDLVTRLKLDVALFDCTATEPSSSMIALLVEEDVIVGFSVPAKATGLLGKMAEMAGNATLLVGVRAGPEATIETMHEFMRAARDAQLS